MSYSERRKTVLALFQKYDQNRNGTIEPDELAALLQHLDPVWSNDLVGSLFRAVDTNANGLIEYKEFVDWAFGKIDPSSACGTQVVQDALRLGPSLGVDADALHLVCTTVEQGQTAVEARIAGKDDAVDAEGKVNAETKQQEQSVELTFKSQHDMNHSVIIPELKLKSSQHEAVRQQSREFSVQTVASSQVILVTGDSLGDLRAAIQGVFSFPSFEQIMVFQQNGSDEKITVTGETSSRKSLSELGLDHGPMLFVSRCDDPRTIAEKQDAFVGAMGRCDFKEAKELLRSSGEPITTTDFSRHFDGYCGDLAGWGFPALVIVMLAGIPGGLRLPASKRRLKEEDWKRVRQFEPHIVEIAQIIIDLKADINATGGEYIDQGSERRIRFGGAVRHKTALCAAIERGSPDLVRFLLDAGADPNQTALLELTSFPCDGDGMLTMRLLPESFLKDFGGECLLQDRFSAAICTEIRSILEEVRLSLGKSLIPYERLRSLQWCEEKPSEVRMPWPRDTREKWDKLWPPMAGSAVTSSQWQLLLEEGFCSNELAIEVILNSGYLALTPMAAALAESSQRLAGAATAKEPETAPAAAAIDQQPAKPKAEAKSKASLPKAKARSRSPGPRSMGGGFVMAKR